MAFQTVVAPPKMDPHFRFADNAETIEFGSNLQGLFATVL